jgi:phage-related minor tail protein
VANVELATAYVSLVPTMQGVQGKVAEAFAPAGAEADKAGKSSGGMFAGGFAGALSAAAVGVAAGAAAVGGAAVGLYKVGAIFDDVTDTIRVGTGASGAALDGLVAISRSVGASVPTSFEKAGQTVSDLNQRLGLSGSTLNTVAQQYIQAGNILGQDVDITSTSAAFSAFGIEGENVSGAMDSLFRVSQATGVGMNELASQVQTSAAPLQNLGFGFEDTAALAGTLSKAGLNTSQVMGSMGKALVTLAKDGEEPQAAFKRVTGELGEFVKKGDTAGALDLASKVFGTKGASQFVGAIQSGKINLDDLTASAGLSSDTILGLGQETADAAESWQLIKNKALLALEPMGTAVFDLAGKGLGFLASNMDGVIGRLTDFSEGVTGIITVLATGDFKGPIFGQEEDSGFVDVLFNIREAFQSILPIGQQIMASVGPAFGALVPLAFQLFQALSPTSLIFQALLPVLPQIAAAIGGLLGQIVPLVVSLAAQLIPIVTQLVSAILPPLTVIFTDIVTAIAPLITQIAGLLIPIITALMPVVVTVFTVIAAVITAAMQIVQGIIQVVTGIISGNWEQVWAGIGNIFGGIWNTIVAVVSGALRIIGQVVISGLGLVASFVGSVLGNIGRFFSDTWNNVVNGVSGMIGNVLGFFGGLGGKILGALGNLGGTLFNAGKNIIQGLIDGIGSMMGAIGRAVLNIVPEAIRGPFEQLLGIHSPSTVFRGYGVNIGQGLVLGIGDMHSDIESAVNGMVTVPATASYGAATSAGDLRTSGGFGSTFNIYETDDPIATAHSVSRRQSALAS